MWIYCYIVLIYFWNVLYVWIYQSQHEIRRKKIKNNIQCQIFQQGQCCVPDNQLKKIREVRCSSINQDALLCCDKISEVLLTHHNKENQGIASCWTTTTTNKFSRKVTTKKKHSAMDNVCNNNKENKEGFDYCPDKED